MEVCGGTNLGITVQHLQTAVSIMDIKGSHCPTGDLASLLRLCASGFTLHSLHLQPTMLTGIKSGRGMAHTSITLIASLCRFFFPSLPSPKERVLHLGPFVNCKIEDFSSILVSLFLLFCLSVCLSPTGHNFQPIFTKFYHMVQFVISKKPIVFKVKRPTWTKGQQLRWDF